MHKVLHILWNANFGGIEKLTLDLAETQSAEGEVEASIFIAKPEGEFMERMRQSGLDIHTINLSSGKSLDLRAYQNALLLFKKFSVLHLHFFHPILAYIAMYSGKKIVFTEHGNFGFGRKRKASDTVVEFLKEKFIKSLRVAITYNSQFTKSFAEKRYSLKNHTQSYLVHNGIKLDKPTNEDSDDSIKELKSKLSGKFVVGTSSRFVGFKRIERLIRTFHHISEDKNNVLLLVGDGVLMTELKALVSALGMDHCVMFTGYVEDAQAYQDLMDVCVFPSKSEPFGLVAIETLSLGKPTIVFKDGGGLVEIVENLNPSDVVADESDLLDRIADYKEKGADESESLKRVNYSKGFSIQETARKFNDVYNAR